MVTVASWPSRNGAKRRQPRAGAIGMFGRMQWRRRAFGVVLMAAVEGVAALALTAAPSHAQWFEQQPRRQYQRQQQDGGFFGLFGGGWSHQPAHRPRVAPEPQHHVDYSHAPPPHKPEAQPDPNKPITSIVVMGGSMAGWLAYGLEDAFSDSANVEIVRKDQPYSGLLRYKAKSDLDWWHVAREELAQQKANYVVMMLGVNDRQNIRESDVAKEAEQEAAKNGEKKAADRPAGASKTDQTDASDKPQSAHARGTLDFRSDQWEKVYTRRIDKTIAALKSKGVPVFWVGLPSIRGAKSTADAVYLNNLYRARAERAGIVYIDVWDGFVDDSGKFSYYGPDYEGQTRRLRSGDGVFFTKYGARKLAHYVEREIRRYMTNQVTTLTFPTGPLGPTPGGKSAVRPLAGPVLPLTTITSTSDVLLGGAGARSAQEDATASSVLVKGDAVSAPPGRADDFKWPPDSAEYGKSPEPASAAKAPTKTSSTAPMTPAAAASPPPAAAPRTQASAPATVAPPAPTPDAAKAAAAEKAAADAAQAKADAEAQAKADAAARKLEQEKAQAEARRRAAERARAEARRPAEASNGRPEWLRPPARVETRRQVQRRPQQRSNDPLGGLFGLLPR